MSERLTPKERERTRGQLLNDSLLGLAVAFLIALAQPPAWVAYLAGWIVGFVLGVAWCTFVLKFPREQ